MKTLILERTYAPGGADPGNPEANLLETVSGEWAGTTWELVVRRGDGGEVARRVATDEEALALKAQVDAASIKSPEPMAEFVSTLSLEQRQALLRALDSVGSPSGS